ncbi:MAG: Uma2 family endonuclease [Dehalococcoidia bacterium]|nr:Uma2 family endonuclease [Dehalococcoidia bacterium]
MQHIRASNLGRAFIADAGFRLTSNPDTVRAPDFAVVEQDQQGSLENLKGFPAIAPNFVVEVLSPSNTGVEINAKVADYLAAGTDLIWVVDPEIRTVTTYHQGGRAQFLGVDDEIDGGDVLPGFRCPIAEFFR